MIKIGWSTANVSTDEPVGITGQFYQRISKKCMDEITVTVMVIEREDVSIFVSCDFVQVSGDLQEEVQQALSKINPEIPVQNIIMNATHTHASPRYELLTTYDKDGVIDERIYPPAKYREFLVNKIVSAINEAYNTRSEASFAYGYGSAETGVSRRVVYMDNYALRENKKADSLFWGNGYYTRSNAEICLLATKGKPLARLSRSVHSVILSRVQEHSKKPDEARERITKLFGDLPRIELFARQYADGWDCWGNEV